MQEYKITYRTATGTRDWLTKADSPDDAESKFRDEKGYYYSINGIYQKGWVSCG